MEEGASTRQSLVKEVIGDRQVSDCAGEGQDAIVVHLLHLQFQSDEGVMD